MPLNFKLSFEHFDFHDEEVLKDLKHVYHFYNNVVVSEHKEKNKKYQNSLTHLTMLLKT